MSASSTMPRLAPLAKYDGPAHSGGDADVGVLASPGPFTSQPMTATFMGVLIFLSRESTSLESLTTSMSALPQLGQATRTAPSFRSSSALSISKPVVTSSLGSSLRETLMVSPMPSYRRAPRPMALRMLPDLAVPASVMPSGRGRDQVCHGAGRTRRWCRCRRPSARS